MRRLISPISSMKIVPPCACSSQPRLSRCASVKLPRTCPKSSDSSSESGTPAQLIVTSGARLPLAALMNQPRHDFLADAALARDEHFGVRAAAQ